MPAALTLRNRGSSRMLARKIMPRMGWSMLVAIPAQQVTRRWSVWTMLRSRYSRKSKKGAAVGRHRHADPGGVFCHLLLRWLMRPIRHLTRLAGDLAGGSYEQRPSLPDDKGIPPAGPGVQWHGRDVAEYVSRPDWCQSAAI